MGPGDNARPSDLTGMSASALHSTVDVSVLIAVRNGMPHFAEQLDALRRQSYQGTWEVIICDNGSTDDSVRAAHAASIPVPLHVIDGCEAVGRGGALSVSARAARGRFLLFCDSDDIVADDWVDRMACALESYPAVGGYMEEASLNPRSRRAWRPPITPGELPLPFGLLPTPCGANCGLRQVVYEEVGGFDPFFCGAAEETDLFWRVQIAGHQLAYVPQAVVAYRHRPDIRSLLRQWRGYGRGRARLVARYQSRSLLPPESWRDAMATATWLVVHVADCMRGPTKLVRYLRVFAHVIGQVEGSLEVGVLHVSRNGPSLTPLGSAVRLG